MQANLKLTPEMIHVVRVNLDESQGQLARKAGVSVALIGAIERGEKRLTDDVEEKVRRVIPLSDEDINAIYETNRKLRKGLAVN